MADANAKACTTTNYIKASGIDQHPLSQFHAEIRHRTLTLLRGRSGSGKAAFAFKVLAAESKRRWTAICELFNSSSTAGQLGHPIGNEMISGLPPVRTLRVSLSPSKKQTLLAALKLERTLLELHLLHGQRNCCNCLATYESRPVWELLEHGIREAGPVSVFAQLIGSNVENLVTHVRCSGFSTVILDRKEYHVDDDEEQLLEALTRTEQVSIEVFIDQLDSASLNSSRMRQAIAHAAKLSEYAIHLQCANAKSIYTHPSKSVCSNCGYELVEITLKDFTSPNLSRQACGEYDPKLLELNMGPCQLKDLLLSCVSDVAATVRELPQGQHRKALADALESLVRLGLGHLQLARNCASLSTGEMHRIRLAKLVSVKSPAALLIIEEPLLGLHTSEYQQVLSLLAQQNAYDQTVLAIDSLSIEHTTLQPHPNPAAPAQNPIPTSNSIHTITLPTQSKWPTPTSLQSIDTKQTYGRIKVRQARIPSGRSVNTTIPLKQLCCITGLSGCGKSSLLREILLPAIKSHIHSQEMPPGVAIESDTTIISVQYDAAADAPSSENSCVATYCNVFDEIREIFTQTELARMRGYTKKDFTLKQLKQRPELREILLRGTNIFEALDNTLASAEEALGRLPRTHTLSTVAEKWNLTHLQLGQKLSTISRGEFRRLQLLRLFTLKRSNTVYLIDQPCIGMDASERAIMAELLRAICHDGNSVIVAENAPGFAEAVDCAVEI